MNWIDYVLLLALAYFIFKGARRGFIATIGAFIGILLGAWAAGHYYEFVAQWLTEHWNLSIMLAIVCAYVGIYIAVNIVIGLIIRVVTMVLHVLPLGATMNKLIGALLGLAEGLLLIGLIIWVIALFPFDNSFTRTLNASPVAGFFESTTVLVRPLLPKELRDVDFSCLKNLQNFADANAPQCLQMPDWIKKELQRIDQIKQQAQDLKNTADETNVNEQPAQ